MNASAARSAHRANVLRLIALLRRTRELRPDLYAAHASRARFEIRVLRAESRRLASDCTHTLAQHDEPCGYDCPAFDGERA